LYQAQETPVGFSTFQGSTDPFALPVLEFETHWDALPSQQIVRAVVDRGFVAVAGPRALRQFDVTFRAHQRSEYRYLAEIFDAMQGTVGYMWAIMPEVVADEAVRVDANTLRLEPRGDWTDWLAMHGALALRQDGQWNIVEVADSGTAWELTTAQPISDSPIGCVRWAARSRFASPTLVESWDNTTTCDVQFSIVEDLSPFSTGIL
ncbi:MAG: hypothetical protein AAFP86_10095, partial [Planctomycetota bacterium]